MSLILFTGDRNWTDRRIILQTIEILIVAEHQLSIVHGDCPTGLDRLCREECICWGIAEFRCPANWKYHHRAAGPIRNAWMLRLPVKAVYAFHRNIEASKGTRDMLKRALAEGIDSHLYNGEQWLNPKKLKL